jgi:hypothetical protein
VESKVGKQFWKLFEALPQRIQREARLIYRIWRNQPYYSSLQFKKIGESHGLPVYSIRVGRKYRALGILEDGVMKWFWIGSHESYNELIKRLS